MNTEAMKLQEIMTQAQVFASAWALVGGRFDGGNAMDEAEVAKNELYQMVAEALAQPQQDRDYTWPTVADYENDVGFKVNQAFKMAWDMARTTNSFLNQLAGVIPQPAEPQQDPVAWMAESKDGHVRFTNIGQSADELESYGWAVTPLYTSPPARKPLTDGEIESMWIGSVGFLNPMLNQHTRLAFARAIEAAHGIKENS